MISEEYKKLNKMLHDLRPDYGANGHRYADLIKKLADEYETKQILDYGCGKQTLKKVLKDYNVIGYDPAIEELSESPKPTDVVYCGDVLEHIEPNFLDNVLDDLKRVTKKTGYFVIHTGPATKTLPDGRNAHLIQEDVSWWKPRIEQRFCIKNIEEVSPEIIFTVTPL